MHSHSHGHSAPFHNRPQPPQKMREGGKRALAHWHRHRWHHRRYQPGHWHRHRPRWQLRLGLPGPAGPLELNLCKPTANEQTTHAHVRRGGTSRCVRAGWGGGSGHIVDDDSTSVLADKDALSMTPPHAPKPLHSAHPPGGGRFKAHRLFRRSPTHTRVTAWPHKSMAPPFPRGRMEKRQGGASCPPSKDATA